ncbi:hypothetical protein [Spirosoma radiotolerans]
MTREHGVSEATFSNWSSAMANRSG